MASFHHNSVLLEFPQRTGMNDAQRSPPSAQELLHSHSDPFDRERG
jgi:hypothetical protein